MTSSPPDPLGATAARPSRRELREPAPTSGLAGPVLVLFIGGVSLAVALVLLWGLGQREPGGDAADPPPAGDAAITPPGSPTAPPTPDAAPSTLAGDESPAVPTGGAVSDAEVAAAVARLDAAVETSDCANLYVDAQAFHGYVVIAGASGTWADLVAARRPAVAVEALAGRCDPQYAQRLARYVIDDPRSDALLVYTLQDHFAELPQEFPAPADALDAEAVRTPDGNIGCTLTRDGVGCVVHVHDFTEPPECLEGASGDFSVALFATEVYPCAGTVTGGSTVLHEGRSTAVGDYACTAGHAGVHCWHTVSGQSFTLTPTAFTPARPNHF